MARRDLSEALGNNSSYIQSQLPSYLSSVYNEAINEFKGFRGIDEKEISSAKDRFNGWVRYGLDINKNEGRLDVDRFASTLREALPEIIEREDFAVVAVLGNFIDGAIGAGHHMKLQRVISPYLIKSGKMQPRHNGENYEGIFHTPLIDPLLTKEEAFDLGQQVFRFVEIGED